nr:MAG TPA: hypothetical protein [Caudoviricetes sp.]
MNTPTNTESIFPLQFRELNRVRISPAAPEQKALVLLEKTVIPRLFCVF